MDTRRRRSPLAAVLVLAGLTLAAGPVAAQRSLVFERFDGEYVVRSNGEVLVTEVLQPRFRGSWNGILRDVSLQQTNARGRRVRVEVELLSVTGENGVPLHHEVEAPDRWTRRFRIWVPGARDATRTVVIRYVIRGALRFFDEGNDAGPLDELYWQVTGTNWEVPIQAASAVVVLPEGVNVQQAAAYVGGPASTAQTPVQVSEGVATVGDAGPFRPGEGLTVAVGWAPGAVARPSVAGRVQRTYWPLALPLLVLAFAYRAWSRRGRDPEPRSIMVRYDPPYDLRPAELGTLVDHKADMHDITAMLVDLAVRGWLRIEELEKTGLLAKFKDADYRFHLLRPYAEWRGLEPYERRFLEGVFGVHYEAEAAVALGGVSVTAPSGEDVEAWSRYASEDPEGGPSAYDASSVAITRLSDLENEFYKKIRGIKDAIYERLIERGFYTKRPDRVLQTWMGIATVLLMGGVGFFFFQESGLASPWVEVLAVAAAVSGVIVGIFGSLMPARTEKGARAREEALGFKEFLAKVEADRFRRMITSPKLFEEYLPHAMAFRVEEEWVKAFEDLYTESPDWYVGRTGAFDAGTFTHNLSSMASRAGSTMSSSPSGSGGGGSVGGGGGGGGGGGF